MKSKKAKGKKGLTVIGVIPARYASTRLPAKALADVHGKPMIQHVYERCLKAKLLDEVLVATDDKRIYNAVVDFGGNAVMTSRRHKSGTDRIGETVRNIKCDIVVNIQGDEPMISPVNIDKAIEPFLRDSKLEVSTLCINIKNNDELFNPDVVKVVTDNKGYALYFSRYPIPFNRDNNKSVKHYKHIGLYVYRSSYLKRLIRLKPSRQESAEKLEQLRILDNSGKLKVIETKIDSHSVDTLADLIRVRKMVRMQ